jgi:lactoylglutathione lyase
MAFIKSPDGHSVELLQRGEALPPLAPWNELPNQGEW